MQIILQEDEILEALESYVRDQITIASNQEIKIDLKAGRGENGFSATLDIRKTLPAVATTGFLTVTNLTPAKTIAITAEVEEVAAISTGEDRVEPVAETAVEEPAAEAPVAETQDEVPAAEPAFAPKAGSLFAFNKKKAAE